MTGEMLIQDELSRETAVFVAPFFSDETILRRKSSHQREWQEAQLIGNEYTNHVYQSLHGVHER
ncbi:hypothetical protein ACFY5J_18975 [Peribacillus butanolivorans]|uniref:Biotin biosynthetic genes (bioA, bioD, orf1, orf2, bioF, bioB) n=1 Tax=Kurthia sp. 538-KA26 TaxID=132469 RepID=Q9AJN2_9BACL|nr:unnamed protein product [Kurthia sp. 538-KA26]